MKYVIGGIGDLLQVLTSAKKEKEIDVISHFKNAEQIFYPFGIKVNRKEYGFISGEELVREQYLSLDPPYVCRVSAKTKLQEISFGKRIIGIHPIGSEFSNEYWYKRGKPIKVMPIDFIKNITELLGKDFVYLIFGAKGELEDYKKEFLDQIKYLHYKIEFIEESNIWFSLAYVDFCDIVIGVDSAIKSYSAMRKIPTICLIGDYDDQIRDKLFINPYVKDGVMKVFRFKEINNELANNVAEVVKKYVKTNKL